MPRMSNSKGARSVSSNSAKTGNFHKQISGYIIYLHNLLQSFLNENVDIKLHTTTPEEEKQMESALRRLKIVALLEEATTLAGQEPAISAQFQENARRLQALVTASFAASTSTAGESVPNMAPEIYKSRSNKAETPGEFIERVYASCIDNLALPHLRQLDYRLYSAFLDWRAKGNELPSKRKLKTKKELNDIALRDHGFQLENSLEETAEAARLSHVLRARLQSRARRTPS